MWLKIKKLFYHQKVEVKTNSKESKITPEIRHLVTRFERILNIEDLPSFLLTDTVSIYRVELHSTSIEELVTSPQGTLPNTARMIAIGDWLVRRESNVRRLLLVIVKRLRAGNFDSRFITDVEAIVKFFEDHEEG